MQHQENKSEKGDFLQINHESEEFIDPELTAFIQAFKSSVQKREDAVSHYVSYLKTSKFTDGNKEGKDLIDAGVEQTIKDLKRFSGDLFINQEKSEASHYGNLDKDELVEKLRKKLNIPKDFVEHVLCELNQGGILGIPRSLLGYYFVDFDDPTNATINPIVNQSYCKLVKKSENLITLEVRASLDGFKNESSEYKESGILTCTQFIELSFYKNQSKLNRKSEKINFEPGGLFKDFLEEKIKSLPETKDLYTKLGISENQNSEGFEHGLESSQKQYDESNILTRCPTDDPSQILKNIAEVSKTKAKNLKRGEIFLYLEEFAKEKLDLITKAQIQEKNIEFVKKNFKNEHQNYKEILDDALKEGSTEEDIKSDSGYSELESGDEISSGKSDTDESCTDQESKSFDILEKDEKEDLDEKTITTSQKSKKRKLQEAQMDEASVAKKLKILADTLQSDDNETIIAEGCNIQEDDTLKPSLQNHIDTAEQSEDEEYDLEASFVKSISSSGCKTEINATGDQKMDESQLTKSETNDLYTNKKYDTFIKDNKKLKLQPPQEDKIRLMMSDLSNINTGDSQVINNNTSKAEIKDLNFPLEEVKELEDCQKCTARQTEEIEKTPFNMKCSKKEVTFNELVRNKTINDESLTDSQSTYFTPLKSSDLAPSSHRGPKAKIYSVLAFLIVSSVSIGLMIKFAPELDTNKGNDIGLKCAMGVCAGSLVGFALFSYKKIFAPNTNVLHTEQSKITAEDVSIV